MKNTHSCCHPIQCIMPPHIVDAIKIRGDRSQREMAAHIETEANDFRAARNAAMPTDTFTSISPMKSEPAATIEVYDCNQSTNLPGTLVADPTGCSDPEAKDAYVGAQDTYDLYAEEFSRDSLDGQGMTLISSVHYGRDYNNAFWNGGQMAYGDGDGVIFKPLSRDLAVVGHELSHGVVQFSGGLVYRDQSGALNEHFADVFGSLTKQRKLSQEAHEADWLLGADILGDGINGEALRSLKAPGSAYDDNLLGRDPQPFHMDDFVFTSADNGGVHINSGIPNHAFYLLAMMLGGRAWEKAGHIWYNTLQTINFPHARFTDWAIQSILQADTRFGVGSRESLLTRRAWKLVGVL